MAKTALYLGPTIKKHTPGRRLAFDIFPSNQSDTCFTVVVYDSKVKNKRENACIIVPAVLFNTICQFINCYLVHFYLLN